MGCGLGRVPCGGARHGDCGVLGRRVVVTGLVGGGLTSKKYAYSITPNINPPPLPSFAKGRQGQKNM